MNLHIYPTATASGNPPADTKLGRGTQEVAPGVVLSGVYRDNGQGGLEFMSDPFVLFKGEPKPEDRN